MKIIPLSLFFAGITLFSCSNESTNNLSTNSQKVKLNKNEVLSIAYDDAKELTDKDIFNMVSSFANMNNNGVSRSTSASFKITKRTYINKEGEFQNKEIASRTALPEDDIISEICEVEFQNDTVNGLAVVATNAELPSIIAFIPNKGNDDAMQLSGANELLYAAKASYLYKAIKTKDSFDYFANLVFDDKTIIMEFLANNMEDLRYKLSFSDFETLKSLISCMIFIHSQDSIEVFTKESVQKYLA